MNKTVYLTLQNTIRQVLSMILFIVLARYLTPENFGKYQQLLLVVGIFGIIFSMGIPVAISYFHGQVNRLKDKVSIYKRFLFTQLLLVFIGTIIYILFSKEISDGFNNELFETFPLLLSLIMMTNTSMELFKNISTVTNNLKKFMIVTSLFQLAIVIVNIVVIIYTSNIYYILLVTATLNIALFFFLVKQNLKYFLIKSTHKFINKIETKYIIAMGSVGLVQVFNGYMDQIMVSFMLPMSDYANLRIGAFQIPFIGIITGSLLTVMIPIISKYFREKNNGAIISTWSHSIEKATILLVPIIIFCLFFAEDIIILFFSEKYESAVIIFQVYMFQWLRAVVIFGGVMGAIGLEKELFKNTMIISILNIILNYILIINIGVIGAAIATTFLNYFGAYLLIKKIDIVLEKKFFNYFPLKIYAISLIISITVSLLCLFLVSNSSLSIFSLILLAILFYIFTIVVQMKIIYNDISYHRLRRLL